MNWLKAQFCKWLWPMLLPALDDCNKRNLAPFIKSYNDSIQEQKVHMIKMDDYMNGLIKGLKNGDQEHREKMEKFDEIINALKRIKNEI